MKRNANYLCRQVAGSMVVVPVGAAATAFRGMITLNETGYFLWQQLAAEQTAESLTAALLEVYEITPHRAAADVSAFLAQLTRVGAVVTDENLTVTGGTI